MSAQCGRYEVLFPIAAGGMAEVHAARLRGEGGFQRLVALKRMHKHLAEDDAFVAMFLDEARLAANIQSAHVVSTIDLGRADSGELYMVMDLVVGASLSQLLRELSRDEQRMEPAHAAEIMAQAAMGLGHAHTATEHDGTPMRLVHRDVSPQNILVGLDGRARIADFGVAHALQRMTQTAGAAQKGKYRYFSPEQARSKPLDARSDVFALGIVAWETFSGRRLFDGDNPLAVMGQIVGQPSADVREYAPEVSEGLAQVVARALEKDREARFQTAEAMARALREVAEASWPRPTAEAIGELVEHAGGKRLQNLKSRIRQASTRPGASAARSDVQPRDEPKGHAAPAPETVREGAPRSDTAASQATAPKTRAQPHKRRAHPLAPVPDDEAATLPASEPSTETSQRAPRELGTETPPRAPRESGTETHATVTTHTASGSASMSSATRYALVAFALAGMVAAALLWSRVPSEASSPAASTSALDNEAAAEQTNAALDGPAPAITDAPVAGTTSADATTDITQPRSAAADSHAALPSPRAVPAAATRAGAAPTVSAGAAPASSMASSSMPPVSPPVRPSTKPPAPAGGTPLLPVEHFDRHRKDP